MSRRIRTPAHGSVAAALLAAAAVVACADTAPGGAGPSPGQAAAAPARATVESPVPPAPGVPPQEAQDAEETAFQADLYFADAQGNPAIEPRDIPLEAGPAQQARRIVEALIDGPREGGGLSPVLPPSSKLLALHLSEEGTAYVDMDAAFSRGLSFGSEDALVAMRSIVLSLTSNVAGLERVKLLVEGREVRELGGHLDLSRPISPSRLDRGALGADLS
ncbi:MAG TPA: GerMN domain-containing protein [Candidatus Polarisedimenticolia bacterium]|nr:GerMN domain-containing protein [Candidatus Polarisedimenticolia bacterium]